MARVVDADRCARRRDPVLFSAAPPDLLLSLATSLSLLERAAAHLPPPRRTQHAVRTGCCALQSFVHAPSRPGLPLLLVRRTRGRGGEAKTAPSSRSLAASWAMPSAHSPPLAARSVPFDPVAVWRNCLFAPLCDSLCRCCCPQGQGRRRRERAGSSCTRSRHEKDDDKKDKKKVQTVLISTI